MSVNISHPNNNMIRLFCGSANIKLAEEISTFLGIELGSKVPSRYPDGEIKIQIEQNVRGKDVFIIQPTCPPNINDNLMETILLISTMRRASARRITAVIPYFGYSRQDRKFRGRVPIASADVARLLESMGVDRVVVVDLHCGQIQGFFGPQTPCDNLESALVATEYFSKSEILKRDTVIVSPDAGGVYRAKNFRDLLTKRGHEAGFALIIKQRRPDDSIDELNLIGDVRGKDAVIIDDIIDTAGTLIKAAETLKKCGCERVFAYATHGLFSGDAVGLIEKSLLQKVVVTNTVPLPANISTTKIIQISMAKFIAEAIDRINRKMSLSDLFKCL